MFIAAGILLGVLTGLVPGIHLNTVAAFLVWLGPDLNLNGVLLIVAMNVTQVFCDHAGQGGYTQGQFGLLPLLWGTLYISAVALLVAVPIGLFSAIYMAEYASRVIRFQIGF